MTLELCGREGPVGVNASLAEAGEHWQAKKDSLSMYDRCFFRNAALRSWTLAARPRWRFNVDRYSASDAASGRMRLMRSCALRKSYAAQRRRCERRRSND